MYQTKLLLFWRRPYQDFFVVPVKRGDAWRHDDVAALATGHPPLPVTAARRRQHCQRVGSIVEGDEAGAAAASRGARRASRLEHRQASRRGETHRFGADRRWSLNYIFLHLTLGLCQQIRLIYKTNKIFRCHWFNFGKLRYQHPFQDFNI